MGRRQSLARIAVAAALALAAAAGVAGCGGGAAGHATAPRVTSPGSHGGTRTGAGPTRATTASAATTSTTESWEPVTAEPPATIAPPGSSVPSASPTTGRAGPTTRPPANACFASDDELARALIGYAQSVSPTTPMTIDAVRHASPDPTWARGDLVPSTSNGSPLGVLAHCVGAQWTIVPGGTNDVGCSQPVPSDVAADLGFVC